MIPLRPDNIRRVLCLGAHADDIEIGCGGTLLTLCQQLPQVEVSWVVFSATDERADEARISAGQFLAQTQAQVEILSFRDSFFPYQGAEIKETMHQLAEAQQPDLVFTHRADDAHQDHRLLSELTWNAFRESWILDFEIPKYEGDLGPANVLVPLTREVADRKVEILLDAFASQADKPWFAAETFLSLMRLRSIETRGSATFAEAFWCRKLQLTF